MSELADRLEKEEKKIDEIASQVDTLEKILKDAAHHDVVKDIKVPVEKEGQGGLEKEHCEGHEDDNDELPKLSETALLKIENDKLRYRIKFLKQAYDELSSKVKTH